MPDRVCLFVAPPLGAGAVRVLDELGGHRPGVHRIWRGQPGPRCPWRADPVGLVLDRRPGEDAVAWLRFLVREVLSPRAKGALARAAEVGLVEQHQVRGWALAEDGEGRQCFLDVRGRRVVVTGAGRSRRSPGPAS